MSNIQQVSTFSDTSADQRAIERQRRLMEALQAQSMQPDHQQTAGGYVVRQSALSPLAKIAMAFASQYGQQRADQQEKDLLGRRRQELSDWVGKMPQASAEVSKTSFDMASVGQDGMDEPPIEGLSNEKLTVKQPTSADKLKWALGGITSGDSAAAGIGQAFVADALKKREALKVDRGDRIDFIDPDTYEVKASMPKAATPDARMRSDTEVYKHGTASAGAQLGADTSRRGQDLTRQSSIEGHGVTIRGQDMSQQTARYTHDTPSGSTLSSNATTRRGQDMTDSRARELNAITQEGNRTQILDDPTRGPILVDKRTGVGRPAVSPSGQPIASQVQAKQEFGSRAAIPVLDEADKLIGKATGSYIGAGADLAARTVGYSTGGAQGIAQLRVLEGKLMSVQPRMEGPQSDKDVMLYRQMAGQIGDPTVPADTKKAALSTIRQLHEKYANPQSPAGGAPRPQGSSVFDQADAILRGGR